MSTQNINYSNLDARYSKPTDVSAAISAQATTDAGLYAAKSAVGTNSGIAQLDTNGKIVAAQIPTSIASAATAWNAQSPMLQATRDNAVATGLTVTTQTGGATLGSATHGVTGTTITPANGDGSLRYNAWALYQNTGLNATNAYVLQSCATSSGINQAAQNQEQWSLDFDWFTAAGAIEVAVYSSMGGCRFMIDGQFASLAPSWGTSYNWNWVTLSGVAAGYHRVRIEFGGSFAAFGGLTFATADMIFPPSQPKPKTLAVVHDSIGCGYTGTTSTPAIPSLLGYAPQLAPILGLNYHSHCQAATGIIYSNPYINRLIDLQAAPPDYLVLQGSSNDYGSVGSTLQTAAQTCYAAYKVALPNTQIVATGVFSMNPASAAVYDSITANLKAAATVAGVPFLDTTGWTASSTKLVSSDNTHPTAAGHQYMARREAVSLASLFSLQL